MKGLFEKIISAALVLMLFNVHEIPVMASDGGYSLAYTVNSDGKTVTVTGFQTEPDGEYNLVIPRKVSLEGKSYFVTDIADGEGVNDRNCTKSPFGGYRDSSGSVVYNDSMKSLSLPNTLKRIGNGSFYACRGLSEIEIPDSVESIGTAAFCYCENLTSVGVLPIKLSKIGQRAFSYIKKLSGVLNITDASSIKSFESCMQIQDSMRSARVVVNEGVKSSAGNIYGANFMETLVFPSTLKKSEVSQFTGNTMNLLREVYILSDDFVFDTEAKIQTGKNASTPTKWYVRSEAVKDYLVNGNFEIAEENVVLTDKNIVVFSESNEHMEICEVEEDSIILAEPERDGYDFIGWFDGVSMYLPGESYSVEKSVVLQGVWKKTYEPDTVLYKSIFPKYGKADISSAVGRVICPSLADTAAEVTLTDENGFDEVFNAEFDSSGIWVNYESDSPYTEVKVNGCDSFEVLTEADEGYAVTVGLREPKVLIYPRINGTDDLSEFSWSSSDVTVAKVYNGVITGCKSGDAVISASLGGTVFDVSVTVAGEISAAIEQGKEQEYLEAKKPITDAVSAAISTDDKEALISIITGAGAIRLSDIRDIDTTELEAAEPEMISELADRLLNYDAPTFDNIDDVVDFGDLLAKEFALGRLNHLTDTVKIEEVINTYNGYFGFDIENTYYKNNKDDVLEYFKSYTAVKLSQSVEDFKNALVMASVKNAVNYSSLAVVIEDLKAEIGYNEQHYAENRCSSMHMAIADAKGGFVNKGELRKYIDNYEKVEEDSSSGGGSSSRKSSSVSTGIINVNPLNRVDDKNVLFSDVSNDRWSHEAIAYLVAKSVVNGYENGSFCPENSVTRAEFVKLISSAFGFVTDDGKADASENAELPEFTDIKMDDWFYGYVIGGYSQKIVSGYSDGSFKPNDKITRQEAAVMLYRAFCALGRETGSGRRLDIADISAIDDWAYTPVIKLMQAGIISGYSDSTFRPHDEITREEAVKMIYEMLIDGRQMI